MRDILIRCAKTFVQAFIASFVAGLMSMSATGFGGWQTLIGSIIISAVSAGIAAVMNINPVKELFKNYGEFDIAAYLDGFYANNDRRDEEDAPDEN